MVPSKEASISWSGATGRKVLTVASRAVRQAIASSESAGPFVNTPFTFPDDLAAPGKRANGEDSRSTN
jgi:hypothetical protein